MDQFRTTVSISRTTLELGLKTRVLTVGSCFADAIGSRLKINKLNTLINPFGVNYNPHSIHRLLKYAIHDETIAKSTFLQNNEVCLNYDFHSEFSALDQDELSRSIKEVIRSTHLFLKSAQLLFITYGTAWIYERNDTGEIVANCHKQPAVQFDKSLLTHKKIITSFQEIYTALKTFNPAIKIVLTVSPVRHLKETLVLNSVSKSILRLACHTLSTDFKDVMYFPAYEIMMDDLRDYRFYKSDMLHPSDEAEEYIWQRFVATYADKNLKKFLHDWSEVRVAIAHKPFHPQTKAHQNFLNEILLKLTALETLVNVTEEIQFIKTQLLDS